MWFKRLTWMKESPRVRGICSLTSAMMILADSAGDLRQTDFHAQGAEAMLIGRRDMDHGHIQRQNAVLEQQGEFRKQDRRKIGAAFLHRLAHVGADEQRVDAQVAFHLRLHIIAGPIVSAWQISTFCKFGRISTRAASTFCGTETLPVRKMRLSDLIDLHRFLRGA